MLFPLLFMSLVYQGLSMESFGRDFITAFPENIAYYHKKDSSNTLQITAFYSDTSVSITINYTTVFNAKLQAGQTKIVHFPKYVQQFQFTTSFRFIRVSSTKLIVVLWVSQRGDSIQSNVVQPVKNMGKLYLIPLIQYNQMVTSLYNITAQNSGRYSSFRLIIINAENVMNVISIQSISAGVQNDYNLTLSPYELYQLQTNDSEVKVSSSNTVAVLLTHPCVDTAGCGCNMVFSQVFPGNLWGDTFIVPSVKNLSASWLQVTPSTAVILGGQNIKTQTSNSSDLIPFPYLQNQSQLISASNNVSVRLMGPGLILELMPNSMFAACFLVQMNSTDAEALIIAETASRANVYIDGDLLLSSDWKSIANSNYSSVSVSLSGTHVIWHPTSRVGVYMFQMMKSGIPYGSAAVILNEDPDRDGCVADPGQYSSPPDVMTWPESNDYCLNMTFKLNTPDSARAQKQMSNFLLKDGAPGQWWIGLRRSLLTLDWYWQKGNDSQYNVSYTKWADGHPDKPWKALCASVSQDANKDFSWKSVPCCTKMRPVCYKNAKYFSEITFDALFDHFFIVNPKP